MFPRFYPNRFALRWLHFTLSILLPLLQVRMKGFICSVLSIFEDLCEPLQPLEEISPVVGMFWCWSPWACHIEAQNFSLGESYEMRSLRSSLSVWAHSTRSMASSQPLFRGVLLEDICVVTGWSSPHTFIRFYNLDLDTATGSQVLSAWNSRVCCIVCNRSR